MITIDEQAALTSVHGTPFQQAAQVAMIRRIKDGDFFIIPDRFGRFHSNFTNLKKTLRPFLRYRNSRLCNLDIANSQPMIFCLLLVNLLSNNGKLGNLIDYEFSASLNPYDIEIDDSLSLSWGSFLSSDSPTSSLHPFPQETQRIEGEGEGGGEAFPILRRFDNEISSIVNDDNALRQDNFSYGLTHGLADSPTSSLPPENQETRENEGEGEGGEEALPILRRFDNEISGISNNDNTLRPVNFSYGMTDNWADDVKEFVELCEQGILYDGLMRRLHIPLQRRDSFKRLFYTQVFFGEVKPTGRVRELFARDFPTVYKAVNDLKRKDHHQMAYLLQAHESKIMIDVICRKILNELPGTFIATIHDSIMTTPDKADEVKAIMVREFRRFGLNPTIKLEAY